MIRRHEPGRRNSIIVGLALTVTLTAPACGIPTPAADGLARQTSTSNAGTGAEVDKDPLAGIRIAPRLSRIPGYDPNCGRGHGCVFGPAWSDNVNVPMGHDGCDTRNNVLRVWLHGLVLKPGTNGCVVLSGWFTDPYTGQLAAYLKGRTRRVQIDHRLPRRAAWDGGAWAWTAQRRRDFANDPANLIPTIANSRKADQTPATWTIHDPTRRCRYAHAYTATARTWQLTITPADAQALRGAIVNCHAVRTAGN